FPNGVAFTLLPLMWELKDAQWSSPEARAKGLRRLALAQLGSTDLLDRVGVGWEFSCQMADYAKRVSVPKAVRATESKQTHRPRVWLLSEALYIIAPNEPSPPPTWPAKSTAPTA